jgi:hypothetical protein
LREEWGFQSGKVFFIRSMLGSKRFVQTQNGNLAIGPKGFDVKNTEMQFVFDGKKNQITTTDKRRAGQTWEIASRGGSTNVDISGNGSEWYRFWHFNDGYIVNQRGQVIQVEGGDRPEGNANNLAIGQRGKNKQAN